LKGHRDLRLVAVATVLCAALSVITPLGAVRIIFAAPLALFLPGYAIAAAASRRRPLGWPELLPLSVGISLAALALGSILLNYTPGGLRGGPWALLLTLVTLGSCWVAALRRPTNRPRRATTVMPKPAPAVAILSAGGVAMAIAALILAQTTLHADGAFGYTQLWMIPPAQSNRAARIGVTSEQQRPTAYRLVATLGDGSPPLNRSFTLSPGESQLLSLEPASSTQAVPVVARLYKRGRPDEVYRQVSGWVAAGEEATR
jgi:hypothetical protein